MSKYSVVVHGGSGTILKDHLTAELEKAYLQALNDAMDTGYKILERGGEAIIAVKEAVTELENNILFNAGRGSVFTNKGTHEMDAAIMDGKTVMAGAVAGIHRIRNPIELAWHVMRHTEHVFLSGAGAMEFAKEQGIDMEPDEYFFSQFRYDQWLSIRHSDDTALDHNIIPGDTYKDKKPGTVGAVACDQQGNIAAATSTGGMTNKKYGRIGDTPVIGAGTYANNKTCAISCTGHGEPFILAVAAYDLSCLMEYKGLSLQEAMEIVVNEKLRDMEGEGGMIGVDAQGNGAMVFNSTGMYRGIRSSDGFSEVAIYK